MKLTELVHFFRTGRTYEEFCKLNSLNPESEVVEVYMQKPFSLHNDLAFFEIEKTEGRVEFQSEGITYYNLFDFYFFLDAIEESKSEANKAFTDEIIAKRLLEYAIKDA